MIGATGQRPCRAWRARSGAAGRPPADAAEAGRMNAGRPPTDTAEAGLMNAGRPPADVASAKRLLDGRLPADKAEDRIHASGPAIHVRSRDLLPAAAFVRAPGRYCCHRAAFRPPLMTPRSWAHGRRPQARVGPVFLARTTGICAIPVLPRI